MDEDVIKEMVILVGGDDNAMIYVKGEIRPELLNDRIDLANPDKFLSMKLIYVELNRKASFSVVKCTKRGFSISCCILF